MDYEQLLKKYMQYVFDLEGSELLSSARVYMTDVEFDEEELKELVRISRGIS